MLNVDAVLLATLKQLQQEVSEGKYPLSGICSYVSVNCYYDSTYRSVYHRMRNLMMQWPLSTGSKGFPVPAFKDCPSFDEANSAYHFHAANRTLWGDNEHAELRKQLLSWMIEQLEKRV
jgi:hypothetical protein